jgi:hypothetical protein
MPPPRTNSNSTLRRPQEKQGKEVACLNEQRANGKEQRALSRKHLAARQGNLPRQSRDRIRNCIYIWTSRLSHAGAECAKFSSQRAAFIHTLYAQRLQRCKRARRWWDNFGREVNKGYATRRARADWVSDLVGFTRFRHFRLGFHENVLADALLWLHGQICE